MTIIGYAIVGEDNDTTMLGAADAGFLFHAPDNVKGEFPQLPAHEEFDDLLAAITAELG